MNNRKIPPPIETISSRTIERLAVTVLCRQVDVKCGYRLEVSIFSSNIVGRSYVALIVHSVVDGNSIQNGITLNLRVGFKVSLSLLCLFLRSIVLTLVESNEVEVLQCGILLNAYGDNPQTTLNLTTTGICNQTCVAVRLTNGDNLVKVTTLRVNQLNLILGERSINGVHANQQSLLSADILTLSVFNNLVSILEETLSLLITELRGELLLTEDEINRETIFAAVDIRSERELKSLVLIIQNTTVRSNQLNA